VGPRGSLKKGPWRPVGKEKREKGETDWSSGARWVWGEGAGLGVWDCVVFGFEVVGARPTAAKGTRVMINRQVRNWKRPG
jgi:hypothetical protein